MGGLLVFTPTYKGLMRPEMVASIQAQQFDGCLEWEVSDTNRYPGRDMRNLGHHYQAAREHTLNGGYDAVCFVEHDMVVPDGGLQTLFNTDAPVVYAAYLFRHSRVLNFLKLDGRQNVGMSLSLYPQDLIAARRQVVCEVSGVGFGCTLIRREVLQQIPIWMPTEIEGPAPDIPFALACLRAGIRQVGRFDVCCGHVTREGEILQVGQRAGMLARVMALQDITIAINDVSTPLKRDRYYSLSIDHAVELQRAGYVTITNNPLMDEGEEGREIAVPPLEMGREKAVATVTKRRPKPRVKKDAVSRDPDPVLQKAKTTRRKPGKPRSSNK